MDDLRTRAIAPPVSRLSVPSPPHSPIPPTAIILQQRLALTLTPLLFSCSLAGWYSNRPNSRILVLVPRACRTLRILRREQSRLVVSVPWIMLKNLASPGPRYHDGRARIPSRTSRANSVVKTTPHTLDWCWRTEDDAFISEQGQPC
ncbi:hypothetical protein HJFPF1_06394 [Paramyrothecium foliicola]|nr:hypothetical protein HJFPF1_06394 [Paramyrothecium foliicola]